MFFEELFLISSTKSKSILGCFLLCLDFKINPSAFKALSSLVSNFIRCRVYVVDSFCSHLTSL